VGREVPQETAVECVAPEVERGHDETSRSMNESLRDVDVGTDRGRDGGAGESPTDRMVDDEKRSKKRPENRSGSAEFAVGAFRGAQQLRRLRACGLVCPFVVCFEWC